MRKGYTPYQAEVPDIIGLGLLWSALGRIVSVFRPASVVYVEQP